MMGFDGIGWRFPVETRNGGLFGIGRVFEKRSTD
jgi:hypothetical protein